MARALVLTSGIGSVAPSLKAIIWICRGMDVVLWRTLPGRDGDRRTLIARYAGWVADYVERAHLADVVLNGHSMGGAITLTLALERPPWLRAIVLTGTGARLRVSPRLLDLLRTDYPAAVDAIIDPASRPQPPLFNYAQKVRRNGTRRQMLRTPREVALAEYEACDASISWSV